MGMNGLITSESVTEGHPDKVCDRISDTVLDAVMEGDPMGRVACEALVTTGLVVVAGEITTTVELDIPGLARKAIEEIGYTDSAFGFDCKSCGILLAVEKQSPDIAMGVDPGGAGDQGMMIGYASNETPEYMPLPVMTAHRLVRELAELRKTGKVGFLRPDGKSQVTARYVNGKPQAITSVVVSTQHNDDVSQEEIKKVIEEKLIRRVIPQELMDQNMAIHVNPTGRFVIGGPHGDTGVTGRKIIVDTYGGISGHGGGAFSGKDPSKVDRSATYMARHVAKNICAAGLADRCTVHLAYAIGVADPVGVHVEREGGPDLDDARLIEMVREIFPLTPKGIIEYLDLRRPIYVPTSAYGHFGRQEEGFTWEKTDQAEALRSSLEE